MRGFIHRPADGGCESQKSPVRRLPPCRTNADQALAISAQINVALSWLGAPSRLMPSRTERTSPPRKAWTNTASLPAPGNPDKAPLRHWRPKHGPPEIRESIPPANPSKKFPSPSGRGQKMPGRMVQSLIPADNPFIRHPVQFLGILMQFIKQKHFFIPDK